MWGYSSRSDWSFGVCFCLVARRAWHLWIRSYERDGYIFFDFGSHNARCNSAVFARALVGFRSDFLWFVSDHIDWRDIRPGLAMCFFGVRLCCRLVWWGVDLSATRPKILT
jgi:hypothetical protein